MTIFLRITAVAAALCALLSLSGCGSRADYYEYEQFAMDTVISYKIAGDRDTAAALAADCAARVDELELIFSCTDARSELYALNASAPERCNVSPELEAVLREALFFYRAGGGIFDCTVRPLTRLWDVSHGSGTPPSADEVTGALALVGSGDVSLENGVLTRPAGVEFDLGGIAKGYALGVVIDMLNEAGATGIVSFGGSIGVAGAKADGSPWVVALRDPRDRAAETQSFELLSGSVAVSGDNERYFMYEGVRYHHILDCRTGYPSDSGLISVAVCCGDAMTADALSTLLFLAGEEGIPAAAEACGRAFRAICFRSDGSVFEYDYDTP